LAISSLSTYDMVAIQANFYYIVEDRFNCEEKLKELAARSSYEKARRLVSVSNGCDTIDEKPKYRIDNINYHTCFCNFKHPSIYLFLNLHRQYEKGMLPFEGSLVDQPNYIMEVFSVLSKLRTEKEIEDQKRIKAQDGRRQHRPRTSNQSVQPSPARKR
jgi:hypothetical protein